MSDDKLVCIKCGAHVDLNASACPYCGSERHLLTTQSPSFDIPADRKFKPVNKATLSSIIAIAVVIFVGAILIHGVKATALPVGDSVEKLIGDISNSPDDTQVVEQEIKDSLAANSGDDFDSLTSEGSWHALRGEWPEAIICYEKALALKQDDVTTVERLARAYIEVDDVSNASFHLDRWAELDNSNPEPHALKGSILLGQGDYDGALVEYDTAVGLIDKRDKSYRDYSNRLSEIKDYIEERDRLDEEAMKYDIGEGWVHVDTPESMLPSQPEPTKPPEGKTDTPISRLLKNDDNNDDDDGGTVLIGGDEASSEKKDDTGNTSEDATSKPVDQQSNEPSQPEHIKITGTRYDGSSDGFSVYIDTLGRGAPKYNYEADTNSFWMTIPNAECDFSKVPLEKTFSSALVKSIKAWDDGKGNIRFKIILTSKVSYSSPTVTALGISFHFRPSE